MKIEILVKPSSKTDEIIEGKPLIVRVKEPADKNKANIAVLRLLKRHFKGQVRLVSGFSSRRKIVEIEDS